MNSPKKTILPGLAAALLSGCARTPSVDVFGSFFPVWMFCLGAGIFLTIGVRAVLVRARLEDVLGPRALIYPSLAALFSCVIWMVAFHD